MALALPAASVPPIGGESPLIAIYNARVPVDGVLTGGQPSEAEIERVARAGYRTVVNLRTAGERGNWDAEPRVKELGMRYLSIPIEGADGITVENAARLGEILADDEMADAVRRGLDEAERGETVSHEELWGDLEG